jgi:plastocyanin
MTKNIIPLIAVIALLWLPACAVAQQDKPTPTQKVVIESVEYQLIFDKKEFTVKAGTNVELIFRNVDEMPHNLLIVRPGKLEAVGEAADRMAGSPNAGKLHFVPQIPEVMYATRLLMINEADTLRFKAPNQPGDYPYVCTYPGHWRIMNGIMRVTR